MKRNLLILVIVLLIGFIVNSCGDDDEKRTCAEACPESQRDHLGINENCNHNGKTIQGSCECTLKTYGNVNSIPVYRMSNVTDAQMTTADTMANLVTGYANSTSKTNINNAKVSAIYITTIDNAGCFPDPKVVGKKIIYLPYDFDAGMMETCLSAFSSTDLASLFQQTKSTFLVNGENKNRERNIHLING